MDSSGDEPGIGKGVVSGTVGGICEPIGHAAQVRAEGSPVIRHLDRFWMNNRNTVGEAIFVRDTATYAPPEDDDPLPGSMQLAATGASSSYFLAPSPPVQAPPTTAPAPPPSAPAPGPSTPTPGSGAPNRLPSVRPLLRRIGVLGWILHGYDLGQRENQRAWDEPEGYMAREAERYGGVDSFNDTQREIHDRAVERLRNGGRQGHVRGEYDQEMDRERAERERAESLAQAAPQTQTDTDTGTRVDDEGSQRECKVGPFEEIEPICNGETHHIVPDMVYRLGRRPRTAAERNSTAERINNERAPTFNQGMSICLKAEQHTSDPDGLHGQLRGAFNAIGTASPVAGTAPMRQILAESLAQIEDIPDLPEACKILAAALTTIQVENTTGLDTPGRTRESPLPTGRARDVLRQGHY
ncbi:DUF4150 domain-containing protein [Roseinatronobacter alkalisoli]|uniref:DUF4150 domain-containing protein n=1 Tax=Roseinatronobacter alkalisoli TaxID=3028235 RepID=A0ABT5TFQ1_9RHOB|nr:DUF4150 domain-containing protein [Roseinatronobacter sp. HJB301]MDD7973949.1 DUF4150 domain-containing protein [Roseinatronobacter sp. HJB301]